MRELLERRFLHLTLLAAFTLRLTQLTFQPLWYDEGWSVWFAVADLPAMLERTAVDIHPPLYYALLHGWIALAGSGEFALRYLSLAIGVLTVAALYGMARALAGATVARWSALLAAIAPLYVFYAQEIRMYGLVTLLGIASTWLFWRAWHAPGGAWRHWGAYVLISAAALHTQYYAAFLPLAHALYALGAFAWRRAGPPPARWLASFLALGALFVPWALFAGAKLSAYVGDKIAIEQYAPLAPHEYLARHLAAFSLGHLAPDVVWLGTFALAFVVLALWGVRGEGRAVPFLLAGLLVPLAAAYLVQLRLPFAPPRMERLLLLASPPYLVLVALGLARLAHAVRAVPVVLVGACTVSLALLFATPRYPEQDYRPIAARIDALATSFDRVFCVHPWQVGFLRAYLLRPRPLELTASPQWGDAVRDQLDEAIARGERIWFPAYQVLGRILENEMESHLMRVAFNVESRWQGETRLLFFAPPVPLSAAPLGPGLSVSADRRGAPWESGWGIVPLEVVLQDAGAPAQKPRLGIRLKDAQGRLWAASDREFDSVSRTTGAQGEDAWQFDSRFGLQVPAGTPPGDYRIAVTLYDAEGERVMRPDTDVFHFGVSRPAVPPPVGALPIQSPLRADWTGARLLGSSARDGAWLAGDAVHVDLFWQATDDASANRLLSVQLLAADGAPLAQSEASTAYPAAAWRAGDLIREPRELQLPASLPPGTYRLAAGWLDAASGARVSAEGGGELVVLRTLQVSARPHQMTPPTPQVRADLRFGTLARIAGYDLTLDAAGRTLSLRLHWQALEETATPYKVFVHIVPPAGGAPIAQHDAPPAAGNAPATAWIRGEFIADAHEIGLPLALPPGTYGILVGLYDPQSGARLPASAADGSRFADDAAPLATLDLR